MKKQIVIAISTIIAFITCMAATTIDSIDKYAYGANIGWVNAEGDVTSGAVIG